MLFDKLMRVEYEMVFRYRSQKEIKKFNILFMPSKRSFDESCKYLDRVGHDMELWTFEKKGERAKAFLLLKCTF